MFTKTNPVATIIIPARKVLPGLAAQHNQALISLLAQRETAYLAQNNQQDDLLWQARLFYAAVVAGLSATLFTKNRHFTRWILIYIIPLMYFAEIHLQDLSARSSASAIANSEAINKLVTAPHIDSCWYYLDYTAFVQQQQQIRDNHLARELRTALDPDLIQIVFYVAPFLVLLIYFSINAIPGELEETKPNQSARSQ